MKFRVTMKDPDGPEDSLQDAARDAVRDMAPEALKELLELHERSELVDMKQEKLRAFTSRWLEYGEYVTLEFDTEAGTCVVVPR